MAQHGCFAFFCFLLVFGAARATTTHECDRLCLGNEPPRKCFYYFTIGASQGKQNSVLLSVNGRWPGPLISVCQNDTIIVDVKNQLPAGMETSLHWHGFGEGNSPFMDGVPMITQCPILPHTTFRYQMKALKSGTFYYHAHTVAQQLDGIHGPLIVHDGQDQMNPSKTVIISPEIKNVQVLESGFEMDLNVSRLRLEVFDGLAHNRGKENAPLRLRIINAAALDCPITLFTHIVPLKVVSVDGNDVKPSGVNEIVINPGERIDLLIKPEVMKVTHIVGHNLCKGHAKYGFDPGISEKSDLKHEVLNIGEFLGKLEPEEPENLEKSDLNVYLAFDASAYKDCNGCVDFRYKLGEFIPIPPSFLSEDSISVFQVYNKSFTYPSSPILSQPDKIPNDLICNVEEHSRRCTTHENGYCECLQIINLPYNKNVDLFLIDEGKNGNASQTVHIHGHSFHVLSMNSFDRFILPSEVEEKERLGQIKRNLVNPVRKDTIVVPNKGYVILRLKTNNPGKWLLESTTSKARMGSGLEVILNVEDPNQDQVPPDGFPTCGTMKEPDLVFSVD